MQTTKLKRFATEARNRLRQGVSNRLVTLGFNEAGEPIESPKLVPGGATWKEKSCTVAFYRGFTALEEQIRKYGVNHVVEEAAYTWFNRLMAIRILTMNNLCEPVLRYVGSTRTPLIVDEARQGNLPDTDEENCKALLQLLDDDTKTADQFAFLISVFCHNTPLISKCFELNNDYTDVLFPTNLLTPDGFIDSLNSTDFISEEDYKSSELLGWLYQFYISEKKDQVFAKKGKYDADDIPAATQIFTPNWIVKYMVQNAVIPQVLSNSEYGISDTELKKKYKYLILPPKPNSNTDGHLYTINYDLELIRVADLACGSGHILNECFDLLYDLYISEGYTRREAIECIFTKNLTGIDIDTRAKQLATFALMLKACQRDASLVDASLMPHVYDMSGMPEESRELGSIQIFDEPNSDNPVIAALSTHYDAIVMNPPYMPTNRSEIIRHYALRNYPNYHIDLFATFMKVAENRLKTGGKYGMINMHSWAFLSSYVELREEILDNLHVDSLLHLGPRTFDELNGEIVQNVAFVITKGKSEEPSVFYDLVSGADSEDKRVFFVSGKGRYVIQRLYDFQKLPGKIFAYWLSPKAMAIMRDTPSLQDFAYARVGMFTGDNNRFLREWWEVSINNFNRNCSSYEESVESPLRWYPYNKGGKGRRWYGNYELIVNYLHGGNEIYNRAKIEKRNCQDYPAKYKFIPNITWSTAGEDAFRYQKSGTLFDTKGMSMFVSSDLEEYILSFANSIVGMHFLKALSPGTDTQVGQVRVLPLIVAPNISINKLVTKNISISKADWDAHETSWDFEKNPLLAVDDETYIDNINNAIERHRQETGEEICIDPAAPQFGSLKWRYDQYKQKWESLFMKLHANEEELNRRFIEIYGLQDELTPDVPLNEITILQQGEITINDQISNISVDGEKLISDSCKLIFNADVVIKQFISYAVGCMMGRYRLDRPGLAIAHPNETPEEVAAYPIMNNEYRIMNNGLPEGMTQEDALMLIKKHQSEATENPDGSYTLYDIRYTLEKFWIDTDGIIPLLPEDCGFHDNAANRMATFVRQVLGEESQTENLNFIEECLGKSIEQYFMKDFWKDHKKMYQNRPIYWLFASKKGAFQVLVYVHRMNVATVERIRSRYLLPYIERLKKRIEDLQANESTLSTKQRNQLKTLRAQVDECSEYHNRLAVIAERGIVPDLDAGIPANHALFGDVVTKLK